MPKPYDDPCLAVGDDLARRGVKSSAVAEAVAQVSQDIIARDWIQIEGVAHYKVTGRPPETVAEYGDRVCKDHPNYFYEEHVVDDADVTFLGTDGKRTLKDAGDFIKKYGEKHYNEVRLAYGCDNSLKPGTKPGEKPKDGKPAAGSGSNCWSDAYMKSHGEAATYAERARLMKTLNLKACTAMAFAVGKSVTGAVLVRK